jgi:tetratricopeptide (TPR) repeat protein
MGLVTEAVGDLAIAAGGAPATRGEALDALERVAAAEGIAAPALREALLNLSEHGREGVAVKLGRQFLDRAGVPEKDRQIIRDLLPEPEPTGPEVGEPAAVNPDGSTATAPAVSDGGEAAARIGSGSTTVEVPAGQALAPPGEPEDEAIALMGEAEGLRSAGRMDEAEAHYYRALELFEKRRDAVQAIRAVDRLLGLRPDDVVLHHQKNEFAIMLNDRELLVSSYLDLAACLRRQNGLRSARTVYGRILDLDPGNAEARAGIAAVDADELARERHRRQRIEPASGTPVAAEFPRERTDVQVVPSAEFDDLFEDLRESEAPSAAEEPPDYESHYELGVAFQQMEMWEEAARELAIAVGGMDDSVPAAWPGSEERKADVILMLGVAQLRSGDRSAARSTLERVLRIDASNARAAQLLSTLPA